MLFSSLYTIRVFLKNHKDITQISEIINGVPNPFKVECNALMISNTLMDLISAATLGMELFLTIAILGTALILGIISFSSYSEDKKTSAILTCLGANRDDIFSLYLNENLSLGLIALLLSIVLSPLLAKFANELIYKFTTFEEMIVIPFQSFMGYRYMFPIILILSTILICLLSTYIPLFFSKKISPKEELAEE